MKDSIFNFIMIAIIILACTLCCVNEIRKESSKDDINNYYPMNTVVREIDYDNNIVIVENNNGERFSFFGIDSFKVNDSCALLMYNNNTTSDIKDDIIMQIEKLKAR